MTSAGCVGTKEIVGAAANLSGHARQFCRADEAIGMARANPSQTLTVHRGKVVLLPVSGGFYRLHLSTNK